uniref:DUF4369 domain-containing protein n=1 Tax=Prevotella sp. GTC17260 TaxID=3236796 RepID=A0AB33JJ48_9BACT
MRKLIQFILLTLILVSCGTNGRHFKIDGRLINLNQGEFYVYSPDGGINGMDTIKVVGGRFSYETPLEREATLMIVFPNFSEQPVFAVPGKTVDIKGDASHLKEMEITGTKDNELMTKFRQQTVNNSPPEIRKHAELFIADHADSPVGAYLVSKYFLLTPQPDHAKAIRLLTMLRQAQPDNGYPARLLQKARNMPTGLPAFTATDIKGNRISSVTLSKAPMVVINTWATWSYESMDAVRRLKQYSEELGSKLAIVSICLDADPKLCKENVEREGWTWSVVCDGKMFEGNLVRQLGLFNIPNNIVMKRGRIVGRGMTPEQLRGELEKMK